MVMKHSVVKTDEGVLLEITPKHSWTDWECASFRVWTGPIEVFDSLPAHGYFLLHSD